MSVDDMAVYIANLGDYVEGDVKGAWFHFPLDEEEIAERIGLNGRYEEYVIHDSENFPCELEEYTSIEELNRIYELIQDFPEEVLDILTILFPTMATLKNWQTILAILSAIRGVKQWKMLRIRRFMKKMYLGKYRLPFSIT